MIFADVIVDISVKSLDRPFQYIVPEEMEFDIDIGSVVKIPFGMGNRTMTGYVVGLSGEAKFDVSKTKSILEIMKQGVVVESHLLSLAYWIKENYGSTMNDAIKSVMPVKKEVKEQVKRIIYPAVDMENMKIKRDEFEKKHNSARVRLLDEFLKMDKETLNTYHEELGKTLGEALLAPTRIYVKALKNVKEAGVRVKACSHITGGGFYENVPRMLPEGKHAVIKKDSYEVPAIFKMMEREGNVEEHMMYNTYNMGIGMIVAVDPADVEKTMEAMRAAGDTPYVIGEIKDGEKGVTLC